MYIIEEIEKTALNNPDIPAYISIDGTITYGELWKYICRMAAKLAQINSDKRPVIVYGHKERLMPVSFLSLFMCGCAYIPVDSGTPINRIEDIVRLSDAKYLFNVSGLDLDIEFVQCINRDILWSFCENEFDSTFTYQKPQGDTILYIMFTSGTDGYPKGISITHDNLYSFILFMNSFHCLNKNTTGVVLNQARFSFDLSVADIYYSLSGGRTLYVLEQSVQKNFPVLFSALGASSAETAVMTPSFAKYCMMDHSFNSGLMKKLCTIFFCGEQLDPSTAKKLRKRFPHINIINAYGPTECTVAVSGAVITAEMCEDDILPIEKVSADSRIYVDGDGNIVAFGNSVGKGYLNGESGGYFVKNGIKQYNTGDIGMEKNGYIYCMGRRDRQVKISGYRTELDGIENIVRKNVNDITNCAVAMDIRSHKMVMWIEVDSDELLYSVKRQLSRILPDYAIPRIIIPTKQIPMTENGKCDYKKLTELL